MTDQVKPVSRPWRTFLRFSVRGMIVVVLLVGGWLGWMVRSARIQREAVAVINNARGRVFYNWEWSNGKLVPRAQPWAPRWLVDLIGVDYFGHVTTAGLNRKETNATLVHVGRLSQLEELYLNQSSVGDAGLQHLEGLTDLTTLLVGDTQVTDTGVEDLQQALPNLKINR